MCHHVRTQPASNIMPNDISEDDWRTLSADGFDTEDLLNAVDCVDSLRDYLNDGEGRRPPELRTDLLQLHAFAKAVFDEGFRADVGDLFEMATDLEVQVDEMMASLEQIRATLARLTALQPETED
jgi:hypothetical protein